MRGCWAQSAPVLPDNCAFGIISPRKLSKSDYRARTERESILFRRVDFPGEGPNIDQCVVVFFFAEHRIGSWKVCDGEWEEGELHEMTWGRKRLGWSESWTRSAKRFGGGGAKRSESILGRVAQ